MLDSQKQVPWCTVLMNQNDTCYYKDGSVAMVTDWRHFLGRRTSLRGVQGLTCLQAKWWTSGGHGGINQLISSTSLCRSELTRSAVSGVTGILVPLENWVLRMPRQHVANIYLCDGQGFMFQGSRFPLDSNLFLWNNLSCGLLCTIFSKSNRFPLSLLSISLDCEVNLDIYKSRPFAL